MAKLTSPFFSSSASGRIGNLLAVQAGARGTYIGRRRNPSQPRTFEQTATRRYMAFLAQSWSSLTDEEKATWSKHPAASSLPPYHAYLQENANRFKVLHSEFLAPNNDNDFPTPTYPATRDTDEGGLSNYFFSGDRDDVWLQYRCLPLNDNWCTIICYVPSSEPIATYGRLAHIELTLDTDVHRYHMLPAPDWAWRLWTIRISRTGKTSTVRWNYWTFPPP